MDLEGNAKPGTGPPQYSRWQQLRNIFDEQIFKNIFPLPQNSHFEGFAHGSVTAYD